MENTINLLQREIEIQSQTKSRLERERDFNKDNRFVSAYINKINRVDEFISELNKAIEILNKSHD